jgi:light-regulated signal transduction histidine kinase (bacteriophytochrome)
MTSEMSELENLRLRATLHQFREEALVRRAADLDDFAHIASHELQEPLRKLVAFSSMLAQDLNGVLPSRAERDLWFITDAAGRMLRLVQDLLVLSRVGWAAMERSPVSLGQCADAAMEALSERIEETGAEIARDPLPEVQGDLTMLTQLYQNLMSNALKFTGPRRPLLRLTTAAEGGPTIYGVKDNGIGIEPEHARTVFAPFRRLHGRDEYEGTGIGLAICQRVVERHGGAIWVESSPSEGAHFRFTLGRGSGGTGWEGSRDGRLSRVEAAMTGAGDEPLPLRPEPAAAAGDIRDAGADAERPHPAATPPPRGK